MTHNGMDIAELAKEIRRVAHEPLSTNEPDLRPLIDLFILAIQQRERANLASPIAETCLNLYRVTQHSKDTRAIKHCLRALLRAGRFGRILATRFVHDKSIPFHDFTAMCDDLPAGDRLALAHEMLLNFPGTYDKRTIVFLEGLVHPLAVAEPKELIPFVATLGLSGEKLAFPAMQVLEEGALGKWLITSLQTGGKPDELEDICGVVIAMNNPKLASILAASIKLGFIPATPLSLYTTTRLAEAGDKCVLDMFISVLKSTPPNLAGYCLDGIIAQQTMSSGNLLANLRLKSPKLKAVANSRTILLGDDAFQQYLNALPETERETAMAESFGALMAVAPDFIEHHSRSDIDFSPIDISQQDDPEEKIQDELPPCPPKKIFAKIFGARHVPLEKRLATQRSIRNMNLVCSKVENTTIDGREFTKVQLEQSTFKNTTCKRAKFSSVQLNGSSMDRCTFIGSSFSEVDFSGTDIANSTFSHCTFSGCKFTGAALFNCRFSQCRVQNCMLGGSAVLNSKIQALRFTASAMTGATILESDIQTSRFDEVDLTRTEIMASRFTGVEFTNCVIHEALLDSTSFTSIDMPGSTVTKCNIAKSDISHPLLLKSRIGVLPTLAENLIHDTLPMPKDRSLHVTLPVLTAWSRELTFTRREERMATHNRGRLTRSIAKMEQNKQIFLRLLPHLLHTNLFEHKFNLKGIPSCEIWGYAPSFTSHELTKEYFPKTPQRRGKAEVNILAVYAMGSLGTVAQTNKSDLDCWVCYDNALSPVVQQGLKQKLDAIGLWAESEFGFEAHFFPMSMEDVRNNRFSSGDEESSGSAQGLLLKEEFYRTAIRIAGKTIAWWLTPAGADKAAYDRCVQTMADYPSAGRSRLEDFGHLATVPPTEYFGGSLWQMVKAIHSPFKSMLKLGLLETYADQNSSGLTLCDQIKRNLFMKRQGVERTDPYGALFGTLRRYYAKLGDTKGARLLTEAFLFKTNLCDIPFFLHKAVCRDDASLIKILFGDKPDSPQHTCSKQSKQDFGKSLKMGANVREFMVNTYQRIQAHLRTEKHTLLITPQDLTRMGRRISANFSKKRNKIQRVPFMDSKGGGFPILHFSADKTLGKQTTWLARGGIESESQKSMFSMQPLHKSTDPTQMIAWLLANRLYTTTSLLQADRSIAPIALADIQKLMSALHEFFPYAETFERDFNEGLEAELVTKAFFILNLTAPKDIKQIESASIIYSTNWGELFCQTFENPNALLTQHPSQFLAHELNHAISKDLHMQLFLPKGAQCRRISLF